MGKSQTLIIKKQEKEDQKRRNEMQQDGNQDEDQSNPIIADPTKGIPMGLETMKEKIRILSKKF